MVSFEGLGIDDEMEKEMEEGGRVVLLGTVFLLAL